MIASLAYDWSEGYWAHYGEWVFRRPGDDPFTPLFDEIWGEIMGRHVDADGNGVADAAEAELKSPIRFGHDDGSVYERVDPAEFEQAEDD